MRKSASTLAPEMAEQEVIKLVSTLQRERLTGWHLEIGTAAGGTLKALMGAYPAASRPRFVVVDPMTYFPDQLAIVRRNLASAGIDADEVDFRVSKSWPAFHLAARAGERYAFMFVDGSHKVHRVMQDLSWTRLLDVGGLVCLHDYAAKTPGVIAAVDRFLSTHSNYQVVDCERSLLVVRKLASSTKPEIDAWDLAWANLVNVGHQFAAGLSKRVRR